MDGVEDRTGDFAILNVSQKQIGKDYFRSAFTGLVMTYAFFALTGGAGESRGSLFSLYAFATAALFGIPLGLGITLCNRSIFIYFRRFPFLLNVLCVAICYALVASVSLFGGLVFLQAARYGVNPFSLKNLKDALQTANRELRSGILYASLSLVFVTFWLNISRKMGAGVMRNWLLGKYREPRQEERLFLFLDVKDSTRLAETLGDAKFSGLLRDFFNDLTIPLLETRGEVSHYIGDAAVITWRMRKGITGENAIRFFALMQLEIEKQSGTYLKRYGVVPEFKAGAHCGNVIATEVGDLKSEIVFHGDVLNTVSRVQGYCNELQKPFLVTEELMRTVAYTRQSAMQIGDFSLRGKSDEVTLYAPALPPLKESRK